MKQITVQVPDYTELSDFDIQLFVATKLYESGKLSLGQAAETVNMSKWVFVELLTKCNVDFFNYPSNEIAQDLANARRYSI